MKLFKNYDLKAVETYAVEQLEIPAIVLMEHAASSTLEFIKTKIKIKDATFTVILGAGNNAGDGLSLARMLYSEGAKVFLIKCFDSFNSNEAKLEYEIIKKFETIKECDISSIPKNSFIIDAVFGIGFKGTLPENVQNIFNFINSSFTTVFSLDVPSGLNPDTGEVSANTIKANYTITYILPKIGLYTAPGALYAGIVIVKNLFFPFLEPDTKVNLLESEIIKNIFEKLKRGVNTHKNNFGNVAIYASKPGMEGSVSLAAEASLRSGAGLVSIISLDEENFHSRFTNISKEIIFNKTTLEEFNNYSVLLIGPGFDKTKVELFFKIIKNFKNKLVLDADALNLIAENDGVKLLEGKEVILTPHPGEMARLTKLESVQNNRLSNLLDFNLNNNFTIVLKGYRTLVCDTLQNIFINSTGNPALSKAGTGDVLAGIISSFWAQSLSATDSAILGVYIHGLIADKLVENIYELSITAQDIIDALKKVLTSANYNY